MSVMRYRKTDIQIGVEKMHYGTENMCCSTHHGRQFLTKEEKINKLTEYKNWLDNESKGVEEAITKIQSS